MATLAPAKTSIRQFNFDRATRQFSADISSTAGLGRVYDDACDEGLTVVGQRSEVIFVVQSVGRDSEGDIVSWLLRSLDGEYSMILWND